MADDAVKLWRKKFGNTHRFCVIHVLNAKVTSIYEGHYGVQIGLTGCPAERLRDFSFMLAGHCPVEDYDRWVNSGEQEQAQTEPKQFM